MRNSSPKGRTWLKQSKHFRFCLVVPRTCKMYGRIGRGSLANCAAMGRQSVLLGWYCLETQVLSPGRSVSRFCWYCRCSAVACGSSEVKTNNSEVKNEQRMRSGLPRTYRVAHKRHKSRRECLVFLNERCFACIYSPVLFCFFSSLLTRKKEHTLLVADGRRGQERRRFAAASWRCVSDTTARVRGGTGCGKRQRQ